ncbi:hypothetical protein B566_EDAN007360 [Ephemera danica]|nr:hypothetical protein B566_EDAN007360 [Ephemera danica]
MKLVDVDRKSFPFVISLNAVTNKISEYFPPVLDKRWHDFKEVITLDSDKNFTHAANFRTDYFHVSVLARENAQIMLTNSQFPTSSYLLKIDTGNGRNSTELRHCFNSTFCQHLQTKTGLNVLYDGEKWVHLTIFMKRVDITRNVIEISVHTATTQVIKWTGNTNFYPNSIYFRTETYSGRWRIHNYPVFIRRKRNPSPIDLIKSVQNNGKQNKTYVCIDIFYYLSPGNGNLSITINNNQVVNYQGGNSWKMLKHFEVLNEPVRVILNISTTEMSNDQVIGISSIEAVCVEKAIDTNTLEVFTDFTNFTDLEITNFTEFTNFTESNTSTDCGAAGAGNCTNLNPCDPSSGTCPKICDDGANCEDAQLEIPRKYIFYIKIIPWVLLVGSLIVSLVSIYCFLKKKRFILKNRRYQVRESNIKYNHRHELIQILK